MIRSTDYNEQSSRSHAILQLLTEVEVPGGEGRTIIRRAKLNLVDLAGSEKWGTGEKDKTTQKELVKINRYEAFILHQHTLHTNSPPLPP